MSKRRQIMDKLQLMLQDIWQVNGYNTDIGANVQKDYGQFIQEDNLPAILYKFENQDTSIPLAKRHDHNLTVSIAIFFAGADQAMNDLISADIRRAIGKNPSFNNMVIKISSINENYMLEQQNKLIGRVTMTLTLTYSSAEWEV